MVSIGQIWVSITCRGIELLLLGDFPNRFAGSQIPRFSLSNLKAKFLHWQPSSSFLFKNYFFSRVADHKLTKSVLKRLLYSILYWSVPQWWFWHQVLISYIVLTCIFPPLQRFSRNLKCKKEKNIAVEKKWIRKCRQAFPPSPPLTAPNSDSWPHWVASPPPTPKKSYISPRNFFLLLKIYYTGQRW